MCPRERFSYYKSLFRLVFCYKRIGPPCCTLFTFVTCCSLQFILSQNYLLPLISVLAENTLLKTDYHFLLLLVGFDTLTYRKDYDRSPILVGHQGATLYATVLCAGACALVEFPLIRLWAWRCRAKLWISTVVYGAKKISFMRCSIWWLRIIDRIASSSMVNSSIHRHVWIHCKLVVDE